MQRFSGLELRSITFNTLFQFAVRIFGSTGTLVATLLIGYYAGYEALGSFTKVTVFVSIFYLLMDFGINPIFLKKHFLNIHNQMGNLVLFRLGIAIILIPIVVLTAFLLPSHLQGEAGFTNLEKIGIGVYSLTLVSIALNNSLQVYLQKKLSYQFSLLPSLLSSLILIAIIYYAVRNSNFLLLFSAYIVSGSLYAILLYAGLKRTFSLSLHSKRLRSFSKTLLIASLPFGTILFFNLLYSKVDTFILALYHSNTDIGIYGIAYKFFDVAIALPAFFANSIYPFLLEARSNKKNYYNVLNKYLILMAIAGVLLSIIICIFAPVIGILKNDFLLSSLPLQFLATSLPFFFLTGILQWHFLIKGKVKFLASLYLFALLTNIFLNFIFVPKYSYNAAALTTVISEALVFFVMIWYFRQTKDKD